MKLEQRAKNRLTKLAWGMRYLIGLVRYNSQHFRRKVQSGVNCKVQSYLFYSRRRQDKSPPSASAFHLWTIIVAVTSVCHAAGGWLFWLSGWLDGLLNQAGWGLSATVWVWCADPQFGAIDVTKCSNCQAPCEYFGAAFPRCLVCHRRCLHQSETRGCHVTQHEYCSHWNLVISRLLTLDSNLLNFEEYSFKTPQVWRCILSPRALQLFAHGDFLERN